jgi:hypothetical protein
MVYSCPICTGDTNVYNKTHLSTSSSPDQPYSNYENITFDYLMNHFLNAHQFKAVPLFVCTLCNCVRVSLIDCVYHYIRNHFNKKITIGLCAYNIHDKIQAQIAQLNQSAGLNSHPTPSSSSHKSKSASQQHAQASTQLLPVAATNSHTIYGSGPLIYCATCNENYSNEASFIRHSFLSHLLDPNVNLNWYKVYTPASSTSSPSSLQQIAAAMAMADLTAADGTVSLIDSNGQPIASLDQQLALNYECPLCAKSVQSKDSISRHLLYHSINEHYEYDISCSSCTKQLSPSSNLAECLLHTREFRAHRLSVNFHKYVLGQSQETSSTPMVACVLCNSESSNLLACTGHIMLDHFGYDSNTIKIKRFVQNKAAKLGATMKSAKGEVGELVEYFASQFPALTNEIVASLMFAAKEPQQAGATNKPDVFFAEVKCFKCDKFASKLKSSLFQHLSCQHGFEMKDLDRLYEAHIQRQLERIDREQLVENYDRQQKEVYANQQALLKDSREKIEQQIATQLAENKTIVQQQHQMNQKAAAAAAAAAVSVAQQPSVAQQSNEIVLAAQENNRIG